ncbi:GapA-binding peptide SR1P [Neobacillus sp. SM06]
MGTIVCQACNSTIDHFEDEKVTVLYSKCSCHHCQSQEGDKNTTKAV